MKAFSTDRVQPGQSVSLHGVQGLGTVGDTPTLVTSQQLASKNNIVNTQIEHIAVLGN
jgi:hypothetical protein